MNDRIFVGYFPCVISYADRKREVNGDYARLATLSYSTLELVFDEKCPVGLRNEIVQHAATIEAKRGQNLEVSACGQTMMLGQSV